MARRSGCSNLASDVILYEYPFNERIRTYLRLEHLFRRLGELVAADSALSHHYAVVTIFEIMDVAARADLKADVLRDLDKHKAVFNGYRGNPAIQESVLDQVIGQLSSLGSGGANSLIGGNTVQAQKIIDEAIKQVATQRGRLGALQKNVLETNINSLNVALENVTASESDIRDADFATETAALTRSQILVQANQSVLSQANSAPQSVLRLLQG